MIWLIAVGYLLGWILTTIIVAIKTDSRDDVATVACFTFMWPAWWFVWLIGVIAEAIMVIFS